MVGVLVRFASDLPSLFPRSDSVSLVSRQSDLATYAGKMKEKTEPWKFDAKVQKFFEICKSFN